MRLAALPILALMFLSFGVIGSGAAATCPPNTLFADNVTTTSTDSTGSFSRSHACTFFSGTSTATCSYNLRLGKVNASTNVSTRECGNTATVTTHDTYTVLGPDTTVTITFLALMSGSMGGFSSFGQASINDGTANAATLASQSGTVSIPITCRVGRTFDLYLKASSTSPNGPGSYNVSGILSFFGVAGGCSIVSCQGLFSDFPVSTLHASWGRVKAIYR